MKRKAIYVLVTIILFSIFQKIGIECSQHGFATAGFYFVVVANLLKLAFLVLLIVFLGFTTRSLKNPGIRLLFGILCIPIFVISFGITLISGRIILNNSRPAKPGIFINNKSTVRELTDLANDMIQKKKIFWVGNGRSHFIFGISYKDAGYRFSSSLVSKDYDFNEPAPAEDISKVQHLDLPGQRSFSPTDKILLDPNDYSFCKKASEKIRLIGFDNVKLYPEQNVVQFQIYDFIGWDSGYYLIYYFCPETVLPEEFKYTQKLDANWYYAKMPRFSK